MTSQLLFLYLGIFCLLIEDVISEPDPLTCRHETKDLNTGEVLKFINLHLIRPTNDFVDFVTNDRFSQDFIYNFRICENIVQRCGSEEDTVFCQRALGGDSVSLGKLGTQVILDYPSSEKYRGVMIEYKDGTICQNGRKRRVILTLECDLLSKPPLSNIVAGNHQSKDPCEYEFHATSPYACPEESGSVACSAQVGCSSCNLLVDCGWCSTTQTCHKVSSSIDQPENEFCLGTKSWFSGNPYDCVECPKITSCSECSSFPDCKWCKETGCQYFSDKDCEITECKCPTCEKGFYCPSDGGSCKKVPSVAVLSSGGLVLGLIIACLGAGLFFFFNTQRFKYEGI